MRARIASGLPFVPSKHGFDEDQIVRRGGFAIGEGHVGWGQLDDVALAVDGGGFDEDVLDLAAIAARVHPQRAADRAGNAAQEFETRDAGIGRSRATVASKRCGAGANARAFDRRSAESRREAGSPRRGCRRRAPEDWSRRRSPDTRRSAGLAARNVARSSTSAGRNRTSAGPPARNQTRSLSGASCV